MKYFKKILKSFLFAAGSIIILTFLFTVLNYFDIINGKVMSIAKVIIPLFSLALGGFIMSKNANKNGWLEGAKIGLIIILLIAIGNLIFNQGINTKDFIFYALLLISAIFGSMFGINMKKETK